MPAATFRHSVGVLITADQSSPFPDEHSFALLDGQLVERLGFGSSGWCAPPSRNPPEGNVTTLYAPTEEWTDADMTAAANLLAQHRARYRVADVFIADHHPAYALLTRWASGGAMAGRVDGGWGTDDSPDEADDQEGL